MASDEPRSGNCPECGRWRRALHPVRSRYMCANCLEDRARLQPVATVRGVAGTVEVFRDPATGAFGMAGPNPKAAGLVLREECSLADVIAMARRAAAPVEGGN